MRGLLFLVGLSVAAAATPSPALAQPQRTAIAVDARAEVASALYAASATQAAAERAADARLRAQAAEIERLRREGRASRNQITELEERYVADLAQRDRTYAQEIAAFRSAVEDIASTPEGRAILAQRRPGNLREARRLLLQLAESRRHAREVENAADIRAIATIALDDRYQGEATSEEVIELLVQVTRADPNVRADWETLASLYQDTDQAALAAESASHALELSDTDKLRAQNLIVWASNLPRDSAERQRLATRAAALVATNLAESGPDDLDWLRISAALQIDFSAGPGDAAELRALNALSDRFWAALGEQASRTDVNNAAILLSRAGELALTLGPDFYVEAQAHFDRSLIIRQFLYDADPNSTQNRLALVKGYQDRVLVATLTNDWHSVLSFAQRGLDLLGPLIQSDPNRRAFLLARSNFQQFIPIAQQRIAASDVLSRIQTQLDQAESLARRGQTEQARMAYEATLSALRNAFDATPDNADLERALFVILTRTGSFESNLGNANRAVVLTTESVTLSRAIAARSTQDEARRDLSVALLANADALFAVNRLDEAGAAYQESLALREAALARAPQDAQLNRDVAIALERWGKFALARGQLADAHESFARHVAIFSRLLQSNPQSTDLLGNLARGYFLQGQVAFQAHRVEEARAHYQASAELRARVVADSPNEFMNNVDLALTQERLGDVAARMENRAAARAAYSEALDTLRTIEGRAPEGIVRPIRTRIERSAAAVL